MSTVFISYARKNQSFAFFLRDMLEDSGYTVWIDSDSIPGGEKWAAQIESAIEECQSVAFIVTPEAVESEWVNREIELAIAHEKRVVPIMLEGELPRPLLEYQWIDFRKILGEFEKAFPARTADALIGDLQRQLEDDDSHVRLKAIALIEALMGVDKAVPRHLLLDRLADSSPQVRVEAARALGGLTADWALDDLISRLGDDNDDVRIWAAWALGKIGDIRARQPLVELQSKEHNARVRRWVKRALASLPQSE
jgi:hypothetical protein